MFRKIIFILILGCSTSLLLYAQSDTPLTLEGDGTSPAIEHIRNTRDTPDDVLTEQFTDPGAVIFHDGQFHMFRNAFVGWPASVWVHHMVSDDGITWEQPSNDPVLHTDDVPFADVAALASSVLVEEDGTWVLYFYTWNALSGNNSDGEIGRATADNPQGPWTVDDMPVLSFDETSDLGGVGAPHVIRTDDGYLMYYDSFNMTGTNRSVGLATSDDGINWVKSDSNPILKPQLDWEGTLTHQARVMPVEDGYLMIYRAAIQGVGGMRIGVATSEDGITWQRADEPILAPDMLEDHRAIWYTATAIVDDTVYLFAELMPLANVTDIFTFTSSVDSLSDLVEE